MKKEKTKLKKIKAKFQEFLKKEFSDTKHKLEDNIIKVMRITFKAGAIAGTDLFIKFYKKG